MSTNWRSGDKAVCVDDSPDFGYMLQGIIKPTGLTKGTVYLVTDAWPSVDTANTLLSVAGVAIQTCPMRGIRRGYRSTRFRKVVTRTEREAIEQEATQ